MEQADVIPDVDPQIVEALKGKDRIYVLKLGETFESLLIERERRYSFHLQTLFYTLVLTIIQNKSGTTAHDLLPTDAHPPLLWVLQDDRRHRF
jgi:hypothetical protein